MNKEERERQLHPALRDAIITDRLEDRFSLPLREIDYPFLAECIIEQIARALEDSTSPAAERHVELYKLLSDPTYRSADRTAEIVNSGIRSQVTTLVHLLQRCLQ